MLIIRIWSNTNTLEYKHAFNTRVNSPAVSEGAVGVGESTEVDVVGGMVPGGTTSDVPKTMYMCNEYCDTLSYTLKTPFTIYTYMYKL